MDDAVPGHVDSSRARLGPFRSSRRVSFVLHEVAEYVVAAALVAVGTRASGATELLLVVAGAALLLVGVVTDGKLGALSWLSRRTHHVADLAIVVALALSPAAFFAELHLVGTAVAELVALVLLRVERGTLYVDAPRRPARGVPGRGQPQGPGPLPGDAAAGGTAAGDAVPASAPQVSEAAQRIGAGAAAAATVAAAAASQLGPAAGRAARIGFRSMGLVAGATRRAARDHRAERGRSGD